MEVSKMRISEKIISASLSLLIGAIGVNYITNEINNEIVNDYVENEVYKMEENEKANYVVDFIYDYTGIKADEEILNDFNKFYEENNIEEKSNEDKIYFCIEWIKKLL